MAGNRPRSSTTALPSDNVLRFAWTIVRSKPNGLSVTDYISRLRVYRSSDQAVAKKQHLDVDGFWRSEAERLNEELVEVRQRLASVELERADLQQKLKEQNAAVPGSKKRKKATSQALTKAPSSLAIEKKADKVDRRRPGVLLLQHFLDLSLADSKPPNNDDIAHHLVSVADDIADLVVQARRRFTSHPEGTGDESPIVALAVVEHVFPVLVTTAGKIDTSTKGLDAKNHIIYSLVQIFVRMLDALLAISIHESQQYSKRQLQRRGSSQGVQEQQNADTITTQSPIASRFTSLLSKVVDQLDRKSSAHRCLYEGFAYCILDRASTRLHTAVFGWSRRPTMEEELTIRISAAGLDEDDSADPESDELVRSEARVQAPFLVKLVESINNVSEDLLNASKVENGSPRDVSLTVKARERLQQTLVACMLGTDPDPALLECLKMPVKPTSPMRIPKAEEKSIERWFTSEIWRLIGWDILAREDP